MEIRNATKADTTWMFWLIRLAALGLASILGVVGSAAGQEPERFEFSEPHMGTAFRIVLYAGSQPEAQSAADRAFARIAELDNILSDYRSHSELMRLCRHPGGAYVQVSEELFLVLSEAQRLARLTNGAFDVTVGPVSQLWRRARRQQAMPDPSRLRRALDRVGFDKLELDPNGRRARLAKTGMRLDLGGIAKGFASDQALRLLKEDGIASALVAAGGDVVVGSPPPRRTAWQIEIAPLKSTDVAQRQFLFLKNAGVSTSGDAEQYVEIGGKRYSHIVNPRTGLGLSGRSSVTVVAPTGMQSDSLATAASILGSEEGLRLVDSTESAAALFIVETADGVRKSCSRRWKEIFSGPGVPGK